MKNLIIVESPAKAKTIEKFLGKDYKVMSSFGHIRDLRKKDFSIDVDNNFKPVYEIPAEKKELVSQLKEAAAKAETVWLASDEDREGEAIAWHLYEVLGLKPENTHRIVFHEITKPAILHAIETPREIDINRVNAQQARRVLDRIVGFELSPVLWKKIKPALSAGRVQSVAVRLICEREKEIKAFVSTPYFRVTGSFGSSVSPLPIKCELSTRLDDEAQAQKFLTDCKTASFSVGDIAVRPVKRSPAPPFTTSTLQQEAARKLGFTVSQTMIVAQHLYEAGFITYMRTDSLNLSDLALADIKKLVTQDWGENYLHLRHYHTKSKGAQEAHEAIRPTYIDRVQIEGTPQEKKLYKLIRNRTLASQMADAELEKTTVDINISTRPETFVAHGQVVKFDGFMRVYDLEGTDAESAMLPSLTTGDSLTVQTITATERFTTPPARYNEASLVKKMEELGIGRPSTYAPTISTIQGRDYVERGEKEGVKRDYKVLTLTPTGVQHTVETETAGADKGRLIPTDIGMIVNDFLTEYFPNILDYNFTANIEEKFDDISEGKLAWEDEMADFYSDFHPEIDKINTMRMEHKVGERVLGTDPATGRQVSVKIGRFGPMVQVGETGEEEKPKFASLLAGQSVATITLEEALKLFDLPRTLGEYEGKEVTAAIGRFGPYIRHDGKFVSIPAPIAPQEITLPQAIELIESKRLEETQKVIKEFDEIPGLQVLNGRYGVYMAYKPEGAKKAVNYKLPKGTDAAVLTAEQAREIMAKQDAAPTKPRTRRTAKK
ncbi:MAG: type I DNA topoisomerase [Prevotella sp.]|nr:type I DNA topoisomerase [Prevotella sp.]MCM1074535.1 type I DNA topoisomerase [Ruminococcus sp.]